MQTSAVILQTDDGLKYFEASGQAAFMGLLRAHAELTRALDAELARAHGLSLSAYEIMSRLTHSPEGHLRMTDLSEQAGLSASRVSRLIDQLAGRGLVSRRSCARDSRVVYAVIEQDGRDLVRLAQETFFGVVDERLLGRLSCDEVATLGGLLGRLHDRRPG